MGSFNFYINVDQCLNMSNFDMFFYKLQSERKFHLTNVQFFEEQGGQNLTDAFHEIRSYIDKSPFLIQDYRLIFGMREERKSNITWKESVLYRLLKIYFGLLDAKIFIRSKDSADKNVTVIMLYDTDFTFDMSDIMDDAYDLSEDIELLMDYLDVSWKKGMTEQKIAEQFEQILEKNSGKLGLDAVTERFLESYLLWFRKLYPQGEAEEITDGGVEALPEFSVDEADVPARDAGEKMNASHRLYHLLSYANDCVGGYCVFRKEINKSSLDQNMLALLGIVDYITADLQMPDTEALTDETLKRQSVRKWKEAKNDSGIQKRYGNMIAGYKEQLQAELADMQKRITEHTKGDEVPEYRAPAKLVGDEGLRSQDEENYHREFTDILNRFLKKSIRKNEAAASWSQTYTALKKKLDKMEEELQLYARNLSDKYKVQLLERREEGMRSEEEKLYSQDDIALKIERQKRREKELLEMLRKPQMNPSLKFQDQLNMERALEQCNIEVRFFTKCHAMIRIANFLMLILAGGGIFLLHYIWMQTYLFSDVEKIAAFFIYVTAVLLLFFFSWNAPYYYLKRRISRSVNRLKGQMEIYIRGYFEKAENFREYINTINELDAVTGYIERLLRIREASVINAREYLWHKVQIQEHIRKSGYFENLIYSLNVDEEPQKENRSLRLDISRDVIHNPLYWPQKG